MKKFILSTIFYVAIGATAIAQSSFNYSIDLNPITINNFPGLHSFVHAQQNGKWLIIGGRKDGLHARQPFNSFPANQNNTDIYVIDINNRQFWSASVNVLPTSIKEQLQSTNMTFTQVEDTLYIIGGYAYAQTAQTHKTFDNLSTVIVSNLIDSIINNGSIANSFKQISDTAFAISGGHLKFMKNRLYLVGGHRFDGRYNPMGGASYIQKYSDQIRKFTVNNSGNQLSFSNYSTITDPVHLHRRDYNLLPQIFPNGEEGLMISSGVFQRSVNLPFLYPVMINDSAINPITSFNQYLSNYHSATTALYDSSENTMHSLFYGGMSQYYYQNGILQQDNLVPFVKTISRVSRDASGQLQEFKMSTEMPTLNGASAEFIQNLNIPHYSNEVIKLDQLINDTTVIGYIVGGIESPTLNPFSNNHTNTTAASATIYQVLLIKNLTASIQNINGNNPYTIQIFPNPLKEKKLNIRFYLEKVVPVNYIITNVTGQIVQEGNLNNIKTGDNNLNINLKNENVSGQLLNVTFIFDNRYYSSHKVVVP
tara:strand:+ start:7174 stop:8784 length:1611 start_codon:yes stop_codon:yes gene_type:complete